jgi:hypothetical protein
MSAKEHFVMHAVLLAGALTAGALTNNGGVLEFAGWVTFTPLCRCPFIWACMLGRVI